MNEITIIKPEEFGLKKDQVLNIEKAFDPKIKEREILSSQYGELVKKDITEETCVEATELRRKLVKVRTGISEVHKTQKSFFLAAGKFVDAWKNKETTPVTQMEEGLKKIENHFEAIEEAKREEIRKARNTELEKYETVYGMGDIALMTPDVYRHFLNGVKSEYEAKKEAERKAEAERIEAQRKADLFSARSQKLIPFSQFNIPWTLTIDTTEKEFINIVKKCEIVKKELEAEQKRIKAENERLKKEAELKRIADEKAEKERQRLAKIEQDKRNKIERERIAKAEAELKEHQAREAKEKAGKARQELLFEIDINLDFESCKNMAEDVWKEFYEDKNKIYQAEQNRIFTENLRIKESEKAKAEEERLLELAPVKDKLKRWINELEISDPTNTEMDKETFEMVENIMTKFNKFKIWAKDEIENVK